MSSVFSCWCVVRFRFSCVGRFRLLGRLVFSVARVERFFICLRRRLISSCRVLVSRVSRAVRLFVSRLLGPFVLHVLWSLVCRMSGSLAGQASSFSHVVCSVFRVRLGLSTFSVCPYIGSFVFARLAVSAFNLRSLEVLPFVYSRLFSLSYSALLLILPLCITGI